MTTKEALKILYEHEDIQGGHDDYWEAYRFIEKQLKALEIIKNKQVNAFSITISRKVYDYNKSMVFEWRLLTKEEFDLLKEALWYERKI